MPNRRFQAAGQAAGQAAAQPAGQAAGATPQPVATGTLLREGRAFCLAPWVHLAIGVGGVATPCCEAKGDFGQAGRQPIDEIWHGQPFRDFRAAMLRDERDPRCRKCYEVEETGGRSLRQNFNLDFANHIGRADPVTAGSDALAPPRPVSLDVRFSNLCNFACRMCWHGSSSKWFADASRLGRTAGPSALITSFRTQVDGVQALRPLLATVEHIYWAGGEPLLMQEHYDVLAELLAIGRDDVTLTYNSNMSELHAGKFDILALWSRFRHVTLEASIDGVGRRGELIRHGLSWAQFVENVVAVKRRCPHVRIRFGITVSVFNACVLADLHRDLVALGCCGAHDFRIHPLQEPAHYSIRILPRRLKRKIARRLMAYKRTLPGIVDDPASRIPIGHQFQHIVDHMMAADQQELIEQFRAVTLSLDERRAEATGTICPELAPLLRTSMPTRLRRRAVDGLRRAAAMARRWWMAAAGSAASGGT